MLLSELIEKLQIIQEAYGSQPIPVATHQVSTSDTEHLESLQVTIADGSCQDWVYEKPEDGTVILLVLT